MEGPLVLPAGIAASVEVHGDPRSALPAWRELAAEATAPAYATPEWLLPWIDAVGIPSGITPFIVVARDAEARSSAVLPLGIQRQGALAIVSFLGGRDSNFNMGLFRPGPVWTRQALHGLLRGAAMASRRRVDLFALRNQPLDWQGVANPLAALPGQPSPSFAYKTALPSDPDAFLHTRLSREGRKKLRQKTARLGGLGTVAVTEARSPDEVAAVLDAFVAQRTARNIAAGLTADNLPALRRFLDRTVGEDGPVAFYALRCGERIVATFGGVRRGDRFSGMLISFDTDVARASPGELLLSDVIRRCCASGVSTFDLGIGEARYKETYCPDIDPLFDSLVPLTLLGHVYGRAEAARLVLKRAVKQSRWAWPQVQRIRRIRNRRPDSAPLP